MSSSPGTAGSSQCRLPERVRPVFSSTAARTAILACLTTLFLVEGCGFWINPAGPQDPPPKGPPPGSGQTGAITISPQYAALAPGQKIKFTAGNTDGAPIEWMVNGAVGGNATAGAVDSSGNYTAPASLSQSENITVTVALAASPQQNSATAVVAIILPGLVSCPQFTGNPQVAQYTIYLPAPGKVSVQFGKTTDYGLNTWQVATPSTNGGEVQLYVAGMLGKTVYHMRGQVVLNNGATFNDGDLTCTTGTPPATAPVQVSGTGTPQPGIEMWNTLVPQNVAQAFATDLKGNVIWTYTYSATSLDALQGIQLMPNGHMLMVISYLSSITVGAVPNLVNEIREVDSGRKYRPKLDHDRAQSQAGGLESPRR